MSRPGSQRKYVMHYQKIFRQALEMELAKDAQNGSGPIETLCKISRALIDRALAGDMQAIKEVRDTLDGRPAIAIQHFEGEEEDNRITKIVHEVVYPKERPQLLTNGHGNDDRSNEGDASQ